MTSRVFIDGSNFYHRLRHLGLHQHRFDFTVFSQWLAGSKDVQCIYYVGAVRQEKGNEKSQQLYARQRSFIAHLQTQGVQVDLGYIMKSNGYHEKGVDVKIAVDLLAGAFEGLFHRAYLVSSDTDLIPAVAKTTTKGTNVEYVGFAHRPSYALVRACPSSRLLNKHQLLQFVMDRSAKDKAAPVAPAAKAA